MGVGCGYVAPSAGLVRSQGLAVLGCGSGWICVGALAGLRGCDGCGLWLGVFRRCVGVLRLPVRLVSSGRGLVWRPAAVAGWATGLGDGAAGWGVKRIVLCGAQGSWGAVGAASVGASTLVEWRGCVCVRGWALADVPQADAVSLRFLEGFRQAPEDIRVVLGRGEVAGVDSKGWSASASMASHAACGIHPPAG